MIKYAIEKLILGENLTELEMKQVMDGIMEGKVNNSQISSFLTALSIKGETIKEITTAAKVMRSKVAYMKKIDDFTIDTCGTGGDHTGTFNISTVVAIVAAARGIKVAKHGNRSVSSKCGCADVLEILGVKINMNAEEVYDCIVKNNIGFLFAPTFHPAMKYAAIPRREMGIRTIFNILGPLTNPAETKGQVLGVFSPDLTEVMAVVLKNLGVERAMVVYGMDGMDEITLCAETKISELKDGKIFNYVLAPEEFGFQRVESSILTGGNPKENAKVVLDVLQGGKGPNRDIVLLNAGAAFLVGKKAENMEKGIQMAAEIIDSGKAMEKLVAWVEYSRCMGA